MIKKNNVNYEITSPYSLIINILDECSEYYLTKEEIYDKVPRLVEECEPIITISQLETTLRYMLIIGQVECIYIKRRAYYTIKNHNKFKEDVKRC